MPNDIVEMTHETLLTLARKVESENCQFVQVLKNELEWVEVEENPKDTKHLEKLIENHEKAIEVLTAASENTGIFFTFMREAIKSTKEPSWTLTKDHVNKLIQLYNEKNFNEIRKRLYVCSYQTFILLMAMNEFEEETTMKLIKVIIKAHEEMIEETKKTINKTRLRALFN